MLLGPNVVQVHVIQDGLKSPYDVPDASLVLLVEHCKTQLDPRRTLPLVDVFPLVLLLAVEQLA